MARLAVFRTLTKSPTRVSASQFFSFSSIFRSVSTLVLAEHEGGSISSSSVSAIAAADSFGKDNSVSVLLAGSLHEAADKAASRLSTILRCLWPIQTNSHILLQNIGLNWSI